LKNILLNLFFLHGLYPHANNNVVPGGWSIGTEILFYVMFPTIFMLYKKVRARFKHLYLIVPVVVLGISVLVQYSFYSLKYNQAYFMNGSFIYYSILNQLPVFCLGISLYFAFKDKLLESVKPLVGIMAFALFTLISAYLFFVCKWALVFSVVPFISGISFTFLFVFLQYRRGNRISAFMTTIGVRSYSGYLLHFIFAWYLGQFISARLTFVYPDLLIVLIYLVSVSLIYILTGYSYKYIEVKGMNVGKQLIKNRNLNGKEFLGEGTK
jgi:peptidoglycan/LPS O-acetylase OafA/YrhL